MEEQKTTKAAAMARILAMATRAGERIKHIRPPRTMNKDQENARRRRQMDSGFLTRANRGVVDVA